MRLLLVDDDPLNVELFTAVLEDDGHTVQVARDGLTGCALATGEAYDLILLDIQLPGMTGDAICRDLRARDMDVPVLALSANALPAQVADAMAAGFNAYLTKPISPADLRAAVRAYAEKGALGG